MCSGDSGNVSHTTRWLGIADARAPALRNPRMERRGQPKVSFALQRDRMCMTEITSQISRGRAAFDRPHPAAPRGRCSRAAAVATCVGAIAARVCESQHIQHRTPSHSSGREHKRSRSRLRAHQATRPRARGPSRPQPRASAGDQRPDCWAAQNADAGRDLAHAHRLKPQRRATKSDRARHSDRSAAARLKPSPMLNQPSARAVCWERSGRVDNGLALASGAFASRAPPPLVGVVVMDCVSVMLFLVLTFSDSRPCRVRPSCGASLP